MRKTKVLIVCPSNKGTIAMCTLNLWKAFQMENSVEVKCVLAYKLENGIRDFNECEYLTKRDKSIFKRIFAQFIQAKKLKQIKATFNPDLTISTLFNCNTLNVLSGGKETRIGVFHSPHFQLKTLGRITYLFSCLEFRFIYPRLDYFAFVSQEPMRTTSEAFPNINKDKFRVIYNVHFVDNIRELSKEELDSQEEKEIFKNKVFIYCGRLDRNKAPDRLFRAFAKSSGKDNYHLVYVGPDEGMIDEIMKQAEAQELINKVHYLGRKDNPYKYIARSQALCSSSYSEGLPGVVIEALALNIPVISTNSTRGLWEIFGCAERYNQDLKDTFVVSDGIITPNTGNDSYDEDCLSNALGDFDNHTWEPTFQFENKVKATNIARQFLELK